MEPSPSSPRLRFGIQLVGFARRWRRALDERLAAVGLTDATWAPLVHLAEVGDGISQTELAARVGLDGSSLVRLLDILAGRALVERRPDPSDRRAKRIFLTPAGREAVADIRRVLTAAEAEMLADLTDDELAALLDAFARIEGRIQHMRAAREPAA